MQAVWDFWANYYNKLWVQKYSLKPSRDKVISIIKKIGIDRGSLLDMGCGTGQLLEQIHKEFGNKFSLSGADYSVNMIKQARRNLKIKDIGAKLFNTDVSDIITCTHSLPYYRNQEKALSDMADLLREKGYIIVICASVNNFYDRIACSLLKLTTGKAHYPCIKELKSFAKDKLRFMGSCRIKKAFFMPNIVAVVYKRK